MIYQLRQDLEDNFPAESIFANMLGKIFPSETVPDRCVLIQESSSNPPEPRTGFTSKGLQVISRDLDPVKARKLAWDFFEYLNDKFSIILNTVTIDGNVYPSVFILQISANAEPQSIGYDEQGRAEFTTNYRIIYRRL
jgi:hypothetical protein